jgi:hypothetical protein
VTRLNRFGHEHAYTTGRPEPSKWRTLCISSSGGKLRHFVTIVSVLILASTAFAGPIKWGTLEITDTAILDTRLLAGWQNARECWAHGAVVGAKLAAMSSVFDAYPDWDETDYNEGGVHHGHSLPYQESTSGRHRATDYDWGAREETESRRQLQEAREQEEEDIRPYWEYLSRIEPEDLADYTEGAASNGPSTLINSAKAIGLDKAVDIKYLPGHEEGGKKAAKKIVKSIYEGMKMGVRFEGFFDMRHAMAIIGADMSDNSIWVTDSEQGGRVLKLSLVKDTYVDYLMAFARKNSRPSVEWLDDLVYDNPNGYWRDY